MLGGLLLFVSTVYCGPVSVHKSGRRRGCEGGGIYPELAWLGFVEGKSPALVRDVARQTALLPSYAMARAELLEHGLKLNIKVVHKISQHAGQAAITYRRRELELFRQGKLPAANGQGKRFGAMIDGGRVKLRKTTRKQKRAGQVEDAETPVQNSVARGQTDHRLRDGRTGADEEGDGADFRWEVPGTR